MTAFLTLLPTILGLIPTLTVGVEHLFTFIMSVRTAAMQSKEWTPEMEDLFIKSLIDTALQAAYQPDKKV